MHTEEFYRGIVPLESQGIYLNIKVLFLQKGTKGRAHHPLLETAVIRQQECNTDDNRQNKIPYVSFLSQNNCTFAFP